MLVRLPLAVFATAMALLIVLSSSVVLAEELLIAPTPPLRYAAFQEPDAAAAIATDEGEDAAEEEDDDLDFLDQDISEIRSTQVTAGAMSTEIESVSRTAQPLAKTPAAVYVITNEMIRRSGARNIPEVLRMVPGLQVARISADTWAISIRGFNSQYANKLLVQIDGRAVYTPTFSGVLWNQHRLLLRDVDRIEIIRGPGGTVWGANAVNGIISITTKSSADTQGIYAEVGGGTEHRVFSGVRVGGSAGESVTYRIWGVQDFDDSGYQAVGPATDGFNAGKGGFRVDWSPTQCDMVTMQGDYLGGEVGRGTTTDVSTSNAILRWNHEIDEDRDWTFQAYWDTYVNDAGGVGWSHVAQKVCDFDYQYHTRLNRYHDVVTGIGYRNSATELDFAPVHPLAVVPPRDTFDIVSYFLQDTIELVDDSVYLTLGCKFEHNEFTGFEYQPSIRVAWVPDEKTSIWGSVGRAVRTPSIVDRNLLYTQQISPGPIFPTNMVVFGNPLVGSEEVIAYEAGIRRQPNERFFWDLAVFFNRYDDLMLIESTGLDIPPPATNLNFLTVNAATADTYGFEWAATYEVNQDWKVRGSYSFFVEDIVIPVGMQTFVTNPGLTPRNMVYFNSGWNLRHGTTFDVALRYVDALAAGIPDYLVADVRLARQFDSGIEVALVGQNLFDNRHPEFNASGLTTAVEVESGVYGMVSWDY